MSIQIASIIGADATGCFDCTVLEPKNIKYFTEFSWSYFKVFERYKKEKIYWGWGQTNSDSFSQ